MALWFALAKGSSGSGCVDVYWRRVALQAARFRCQAKVGDRRALVAVRAVAVCAVDVPLFNLNEASRAFSMS